MNDLDFWSKEARDLRRHDIRPTSRSGEDIPQRASLRFRGRAEAGTYRDGNWLVAADDADLRCDFGIGAILAEVAKSFGHEFAAACEIRCAEMREEDGKRVEVWSTREPIGWGFDVRLAHEYGLVLAKFGPIERGRLYVERGRLLGRRPEDRMEEVTA